MPKSSNNSSELSPKYAVLGFLYIRPMYGYELHKHLQTSLREVWRISQSQAYNIIKNLEKDNWITTTIQVQEKLPDRELLALTQNGTSAFETWLYAPTPGSARAIRVEFITRLFFASHLGEKQYFRLIQEQSDSIRTSLEDLYSRLSTIPSDLVFNRMGLELRISQLKAILDWVLSSTKYFKEGLKTLTNEEN